jgi:TatD DNase family protein
LDYTAEGYALEEGDLDTLFARMERRGIRYFIEPGIKLESNRQVLALAQKYPGKVFPAVGVHPTRAIYEKWPDRKQLISYLKAPGVVAIGETGLDYHHDRKEQHRLRQKLWFLYQLKLAKRSGLPLVLHIRDAHEDALRILKHHPATKNGGVVHCFNGDTRAAMEYVKLGLHVGIGGSLLQQEERSAALAEAVRHIPLEKILVETDAPYVMPYCKDVLPPKQLRRTRNSSLILPASMVQTLPS